MPRDSVSTFESRLIACGGDTGGLIARRDWSTSLGACDGWPVSLQTTVELMLRSPVPMVLFWGADGIILYNDPYSAFEDDRHPALLGSRVCEAWPEVAEFNRNVMRVGLAGGNLSYRDREFVLHRRGEAAPVWLNLDYSPVPGDDGEPAGVLAVVIETTDRVLRDRREAFRLEFKARLRDLDDAGDVMNVAVEALATYLGANRVGYTEIHEDTDSVVIAACHARGVAPLAGSHRLGEFGAASNARQSTGRIEVCDDIRTDPEQSRANWEAIETRAFVSVPLVRNGRFTASLFVNFREPHQWSEEEVALIEDVAARTWDAVERARAESASTRALAEEATTAAALNALLANAPIGFGFFDREHRYTRVNAMLAEINGLSMADHIGRSIEELLPVNALLVGPVLDRVFAAGEPVGGFEIDGETPANSGERRSWLTSFFPVKRPDGEVYRVGATVIDITDRKRAEEHWRVSEERLRLATDHAEIGFWDVDEINGTLHWPPLVRRMFGVLSDRAVTMADFYGGLHPEDRPATASAYAAAVDPAKRSLYEAEFRAVGADDGVVRWVAAKGRGLFDGEGRCFRVLGTAIDVTARKAAEAALAASEAQLRELNRTLEQRVADALAEQRLLAEIVDGTDIFVQAADRDYTWLAINRAAAREFARMFGTREPQAGDNMLAMLDGRLDQQAAVRAVWGRALAGESFVAIEAFGDAQPERRFYEMRFSTLHDAAGAVLGAYQFVSDVTERLREQNRLMEAEAALAQAQKMEAVGQLTGGIAHDFNNLLGAVQGSFELILRKLTEPEKIRRLADAGLQAADRGARLTGQLLAFSRAQRIENRPVAVSALVDGMRDLLDRTLGPLIRLHTELQAEDAVFSDATQLEMAILNLAINARDAMPDGGDLVVATRAFESAGDMELEPGRYVEIAVSDTGTGMPPDVVARAFDPFFTTKGVGKGTGLGLSQVYGIARQAGGTVRIDSSPGAGTTVRIFLRRTEPEAARLANGEACPPLSGGGSAKVLIVDDDPDMRGILAASLDALGYRVFEAVDGPSGLAMLEQAQPDALLVDFAMPGMNGAEVAAAARRSRADLPVVLVSGYADTAAIERARISAPILRKPFKVDELHAALRAAIGMRP